MKLTTETFSFVTRKIWGPDDEYMVVPVGDIQVFSNQNARFGQKVKVTVILEFDDVH